jgi:hypothetical protein
MVVMLGAVLLRVVFMLSLFALGTRRWSSTVRALVMMLFMMMAGILWVVLMSMIMPIMTRLMLRMVLTRRRALLVMGMVLTSRWLPVCRLRVPFALGKVLYILGSRGPLFWSRLLDNVRSNSATHEMSRTYLVPIVSVIDSPPPPYHVVEGIGPARGVSASEPWLVGADKMHHIYAGLEVPIRWDVLVVGRRSDVVGEADAVVLVAEMHVDETLVGTIKRDTPLSHCNHGIEITHVGRQNHDTRVEEIWPSNVGGGRKRVRDIEELIGSSVCDNVGVDVDNL